MDLYALAPEDFTAARDAAAKQDRALKALRRPTVSAWVVNQLVRQQPDLLEQLVELGTSLAEAQSGRQGDELRELTQQRHQLVQAVTEQAAGLVDRELTAQVRGEVAATLEAAMADPASADAVRSGSLTRALSYAGFGGVDLEGAVADVPKPQPVEKGPSKRIQRLEAAALEAQGALDDVVRLAERTGREHAAAADAAQEAATEVEQAEERAAAVRRELREAEQALQSARSRHSKASKEVEDLERKAARSTKAVSEAQDAFDRARTALDAARRS